jgi:hypothetical protein
VIFVLENTTALPTINNDVKKKYNDRSTPQHAEVLGC